jgi:cobyrinic acid a,c-diamide synthase
MALIIAGERSGVGKTTITLAILSYLSQKRSKVQSFKVGPDYIDPMFHQKITDLPCRNLDPILTSENYVKNCYNYHIRAVNYALIEGVMGLFDGVILPDSTVTDYGSTAQISRLLSLPVLLVIDCSRLSGSVAAIAKGYMSFDPRVKVEGLILNRVGSDRHLELLTDALEALNLPILGVLRRQDQIAIPDRHLGLIPTTELPELDLLFDRLATLAQSSFDWEKLLPLLNVNTPQDNQVNLAQFRGVETKFKPKVRVAVAYDAAFNFYYQDNLDLLEKLGAELIFWSPLKEQKLPLDIQGFYFGGGFPEVFAAELSCNFEIINSLRELIKKGMIVYGECGGLMYLCQEIIDFEEKSWKMLGIFPTQAVMEKRLTLGYRQAIALQNTPILNQGDRVWGHEFHRSSLRDNSSIPLFQSWGISDLKQKNLGKLEGWGNDNIHASYLHLHWGDRPEIPEYFLGKSRFSFVSS